MTWLRARTMRTLRDQSGVVAVLSGLLVVVVLASAAVAVDVARQYVLAAKLQRAADAAALAAVPYLPADPATAATMAQQVAAANGVPAGDPRFSVTVQTPWNGRSSRVKVSVTGSQNNFFGAALGFGRAGVTRTAVADYAGPVPMGSPCNLYGNEPPATGVATSDTYGVVTGATSIGSPSGCRNLPNPTSPGFWANTFGPNAPKANGDRFATRTCATGDFRCFSGSNADYYGRAGTSTSVGITGLPYYVFKITVGAGVPSLDVQLFDAVAATVGDRCEATPWAGGTWAGTDTPNPYVSDARTRYTLRGWSATDPSGVFCTGDNSTGSTVSSFALVYPTDTLNPLNSSVVPGCYKQFRGVDALTADLLTAGRPTYNRDLAASFRQWVSLCSSPILNPQRGDYYLISRTNIVWGSPASRMLSPAEDTAATGGQLNRYGLRAAVPGGSAAQLASVQFAALERMPMYANIPLSQATTFNLARVNSGNAGRSLLVDFFDVGEGMTGGTITIRQPDGTTVATCFANGDVVGTSLTPTALPGCALTGVPGSLPYNGRNQQVRVPIPAGYTCADADLTACWWLVTFAAGGGSGSTNDTTTWSASIDGDPVRLIP